MPIATLIQAPIRSPSPSPPVEGVPRTAMTCQSQRKMKVLRWVLVPRTCALARPCRTDEPHGAWGTSVAPNFRQLLQNSHALSVKRGISPGGRGKGDGVERTRSKRPFPMPWAQEDPCHLYFPRQGGGRWATGQVDGSKLNSFDAKLIGTI